jgi:hypothetical protein
LKSQCKKLKETNVLAKVRHAVRIGQYRHTLHATMRSKERYVDLFDIVYVLETGYHEKKKDVYRADFNDWNYAIRGKTLSEEELRIAIYFEVDTVVIVTVIKL